MFSPTLVSCRSPGLDDFALAVASPHKNCVQDFYGMIESRIQVFCDTQKLLEYAELFSSVVKSVGFQKHNESIQRRTIGLFEQVRKILDVRESLFKEALLSWVQIVPVYVREDVLGFFAPHEVEDLKSFIVKKGRKIVIKGSPGGKSVRKEYSTRVGQRLVVTYRVREAQVQVLLHQTIRAGSVEIFQRVGVAAGPLVKGAPGSIFARLKMSPLLRANLEMRNVVRRAAHISRVMHQLCVKNIVIYEIISRKRGGTTLAATLYKMVLDIFPQGVTSIDAMRGFLSDIAIPICTALVGMHQIKIAHLDLKAENIFISDKGKAFLGDFGTYRRMSLIEKQVISSPACAAPEIFENGSWRVTTALDIWAFGLILVELFYGTENNYVRHSACHEDFLQLSLHEKALKNAQQAKAIVEELARRSQTENDVPPHMLFDLIAKMLSEDPLQRPTAQQVLCSLVAIQNSSG